MYRIPGQYSSRRSKAWKAKTERGSEIRADRGDVTSKHSMTLGSKVQKGQKEVTDGKTGEIQIRPRV